MADGQKMDYGVLLEALTQSEQDNKAKAASALAEAKTTGHDYTTEEIISSLATAIAPIAVGGLIGGRRGVGEGALAAGEGLTGYFKKLNDKDDEDRAIALKQYQTYNDLAEKMSLKRVGSALAHARDKEMADYQHPLKLERAIAAADTRAKAANLKLDATNPGLIDMTRPDRGMAPERVTRPRGESKYYSLTPEKRAAVDKENAQVVKFQDILPGELARAEEVIEKASQESARTGHTHFKSIDAVPAPLRKVGYQIGLRDAEMEHLRIDDFKEILDIWKKAQTDGPLTFQEKEKIKNGFILQDRMYALRELASRFDDDWKGLKLKDRERMVGLFNAAAAGQVGTSPDDPALLQLWDDLGGNLVTADPKSPMYVFYKELSGLAASFGTAEQGARISDFDLEMYKQLLGGDPVIDGRESILNRLDFNIQRMERTNVYSRAMNEGGIAEIQKEQEKRGPMRYPGETGEFHKENGVLYKKMISGDGQEYWLPVQGGK